VRPADVSRDGHPAVLPLQISAQLARRNQVDSASCYSRIARMFHSIATAYQSLNLFVALRLGQIASENAFCDVQEFHLECRGSIHDA